MGVWGPRLQWGIVKETLPFQISGVLRAIIFGYKSSPVPPFPRYFVPPFPRFQESAVANTIQI